MNPLRTFICWLFHREDHVFFVEDSDGGDWWHCYRCCRSWLVFPETKADEGGW